MDLYTVSESVYEILRKHSCLKSNKERNKSRKILKWEQAEGMMKQQLLALKLEILENEIKQTELIKQLEATRDKIANSEEKKCTQRV
jgi:hypothetical protein